MRSASETGRTPPARVKAVMQARPKECHDHLAAGVLRPSGFSLTDHVLTIASTFVSEVGG